MSSHPECSHSITLFLPRVINIVATAVTANELTSLGTPTRYGFIISSVVNVTSDARDLHGNLAIEG
jgi:hypothetical protein